MAMLYGLFVEEFFQFNHKWFGILKSQNDPKFFHYIEITHFYPGGFDWMTVNETMEKALHYFYEEEKKKRKTKK